MNFAQRLAQLEEYERRQRLEGELPALAEFYGLDLWEVQTAFEQYVTEDPEPFEQVVARGAARLGMDPGDFRRIVEDSHDRYQAERRKGAS